MAAVTFCYCDRESATASFDEQNLGTYKLRFIVHTDGLLGPQQVANGALASTPHPLPSLWATYSYSYASPADTDAYSWARDFEVTRHPDSLLLYYITVTYKPAGPGEGSKTEGEDPVAKEPDPVSREAVVWWDREVYTSTATKDKDGKAIRTKTNDYYDDPLEVEKTRGVLVVEKNVATLADAIFYSRKYDGAVNSSTWGGTSSSILGTSTIPARAALCREVSCSPPITEAGYVFYKLIFRIALKDLGDTWDEQLPEAGQFHWTKTSGQYDMFAGERKVTDAKMSVALAADGTRLPIDQPLLFTSWRIRREVDFNSLPF